MSHELEQLEFKLEKKIFGFRNMQKKLEKLFVTYIARDELRLFFWSHARTPHTQIHYRTHTCAHIDFEVVAHRTPHPHTAPVPTIPI